MKSALSIEFWNGTNPNKGDLIVWLHQAPDTQYSLPMYITDWTTYERKGKEIKIFARIYVLKFQSKCRNTDWTVYCGTNATQIIHFDNNYNWNGADGCNHEPQNALTALTLWAATESMLLFDFWLGWNHKIKFDADRQRKWMNAFCVGKFKHNQ